MQDFSIDTKKLVVAVNEAVANKKIPNEEFDLSYVPGHTEWRAMVGNPSSCVNLGEIDGVVCSASFDTPQEATDDLITKLEHG